MEQKEKRDYHTYHKTYIGSSDSAYLILSGGAAVPEEEKPSQLVHLCFGEDGDYSAYLVDENAEIGGHYKLVASFAYWLKIYDDHYLVEDICADIIHVYRAGEFGCIIQLIGAEQADI